MNDSTRGGVKLAGQEIRNCIYQGPLNDLLIKLSEDKIFKHAWGIPDIEVANYDTIPLELQENSLYKDMGDVELVLRFFALRHFNHFRDGMQGFLDLYMIKGRTFHTQDLVFLEQLFNQTLSVAYAIYQELLFRPFDNEKMEWQQRAQVAFYDAVMIGISRQLNKADILIQRREQVIDETKNLFIHSPEGTFAGRRNTKEDIKDRISRFEQMLEKVSS